MPTIEERRMTCAAGTVESDCGSRRGARGGDELSSGMDGNRSTLGAQSIALKVDMRDGTVTTRLSVSVESS